MAAHQERMWKDSGRVYHESLLYFEHESKEWFERACDELATEDSSSKSAVEVATWAMGHSMCTFNIGKRLAEMFPRPDVLGAFMARGRGDLVPDILEMARKSRVPVVLEGIITGCNDPQMVDTALWKLAGKDTIAGAAALLKRTIPIALSSASLAKVLAKAGPEQRPGLMKVLAGAKDQDGKVASSRSRLGQR